MKSDLSTNNNLNEVSGLIPFDFNGTLTIIDSYCILLKIKSLLIKLSNELLQISIL